MSLSDHIAEIVASPSYLFVWMTAWSFFGLHLGMKVFR